MDRFYRRQFRTENAFSFKIEQEESDLFLVCDSELKEPISRELSVLRNQLKSYIKKNPLFQTSLSPIDVEINAPLLIQNMALAARTYNVGPMAAVAGSIAQSLGDSFKSQCNKLIIENGGDIFIKTREPVTFSVYAGPVSPFTGKLKFRFPPQPDGMGICTSSAKIGHSLSFGNADALVAIASTADVADAAATSLANKIKNKEDITRIIEEEKNRQILKALIIVLDENMGIWGDIELAG
ncbi:MAG: UPF0280 family protein [Vulcanimicrobiota bacterium]